jgi:hypothetical protein
VRSVSVAGCRLQLVEVLTALLVSGCPVERILGPRSRDGGHDVEHHGVRCGGAVACGGGCGRHCVGGCAWLLQLGGHAVGELRVKALHQNSSMLMMMGLLGRTSTPWRHRWGAPSSPSLF